jgi:hypothetical protein
MNGPAATVLVFLSISCALCGGTLIAGSIETGNTSSWGIGLVMLLLFAFFQKLASGGQ